jgi:magnesium transporter
LELVS